MKLTYSFLFIFIIWSNVFAQAPIPEETVPVGYCSNYPSEVSKIGISRKATLSAAIKLLGSDLKSKGNEITAFRYFSTTSSGRNMKFFIYTSLDKDPIYSQDMTFEHAGWNYLTLDTPFKYDGSQDYYIGYTILSETNPFGFVEGNVNSNADYVRISSSDWFHLGTDKGLNGVHCMQAIVTGGNYASNTHYDAYIESINSTKVISHTPYEISLKIGNKGVTTIHNMFLSYTINNEKLSAKIEKLNLPFGKEQEIKLPAYTFAEDGNYTFTVSIDSINGKVDEVPADNKANYKLEASGKLFKHRVLVEQFTSQFCQNCPDAETKLAQALEGIEDNAVWIAHHSGFSDDLFTTSADKEYLWFYNDGGSTYAPAFMFDRTPLSTSNTTPVFTSSNITKELIESKMAEPSYVGLTLQNNYNASTRTLDVTVYGEVSKTLPNAKLNVLLTQDNVITYQRLYTGQYNDKYNHSHALRAILTPTWGDDLQLSNNSFTRTYHYTIPDSIGHLYCNPADMKIVAYVADYLVNQPTKCGVYNAISDTIRTTSALINTDVDNVNAYTSGHTLYIKGNYDNVEIYGMGGNLIKATRKEAAIDLQSGFYIVRIVGGHFVKTLKIKVND